MRSNHSPLVAIPAAFVAMIGAVHPDITTADRSHMSLEGVVCPAVGKQAAVLKLELEKAHVPEHEFDKESMRRTHSSSSTLSICLFS